MSALRDDATALRAKASDLFDQRARRSGYGRDRQPDPRLQVGDDVPNGKSSVLKARLGVANNGERELRIGAFERAPDGSWWSVGGVGLTLKAAQLPTFAAVLAAALDMLEVSDRGLRFRTEPASTDGGATPNLAMAGDDSRPRDQGEREPAAAPQSAFPSGRRGR